MTTATFSAITFEDAGTANDSVTIVATRKGWAPAGVTATVVDNDALRVDPASLQLVEGATSTMFVVLGEPAPPGGLSITLTSDKPSTLSVAAQISIAAGATIAEFIVTAEQEANRNDETVSISALRKGWAQAKATVSIADDDFIPVVSSLSRSLGSYPATLRIVGSRFGAQPGSVTVGGVAATVISWSTQMIEIQIPLGVPGGSRTVVVETANNVAGDAFPFSVVPRIESLSPTTGNSGQLVTATGYHFGDAQLSSLISLDAQSATAFAWSNTSVTFIVPATAAGPHTISIRVGEQTSNGLSFTTVSPIVTSVSPAGGTRGSPVVIHGLHFGNPQTTSGVTFSAKSAAVSSWSNTEIRVYAPSFAAAATVFVQVNAGGVTSNEVAFAFSALPWIHQRYPSTATVGTSVSLVGENFGAAGGTVSIGGQMATIDGWSENAIQITVSPGTPKGSQPIVVTDALGQNSSGLPIMVRGSAVWITSDLPEGRTEASAVWTGNEMIVWGGYRRSRTQLDSGGRYNPSTDSWAGMSGNNAPTRRKYHTAIWSGTEMIVWGGSADDEYTTGLKYASGGRYNPSTDSWVSTSLVGAPLARHLHSVVWAGPKMLVWGGLTDVYVNNGGRYSPATDSWTNITTTGAPSPRTLHTAVWTGTRMVVWGGRRSATYYESGGRYDPETNTWFPTTVTGAPTARYDHAAVWTGVEMIIWGGNGGSSGGKYNPNLNTWQPISLVGAPASQVLGNIAVWTGSEMMVWPATGPNGTTVGRYNPSMDTWVSTPAAGAPSAREGHTLIWSGNEMIMWGGNLGDDTMLDTGGRYNPSTNQWVSTSTAYLPQARSGHTATWTGSEMVFWGGAAYAPLGMNVGGRYNPTTDSWVGASISNSPTAVQSAVWAGNEVIVWGGGTSAGGRYNPSTDSWVSTSVLNAPTQRYGYSTVWSGTEMIVWGGKLMSSYGECEEYFNYFNTGSRYNPVADTWTSTAVTDAPSPRADHAAVWNGTEVIVWGGHTGGSYSESPLNNGSRYDPLTNSWASTATAGTPPALWRPTAVWTGTEMLVWSGVGGRYDPNTNTWSAISTVGAPAISGIHSAVWTGTQMIVLNRWANIGGIYDPTADDWTGLTMSGAPTPREGYSAVWAGNALIVWGGSRPWNGDCGSKNMYLNSMGQYVP